MIFCNTVDACRAVDFALNDAEIPVLSYHGDLVSAARESNLEKFRSDPDALVEYQSIPILIIDAVFDMLRYCTAWP